MSKAPAFQFYFDRFNSSTSLWDDCQVGKYIRLMICQANKGFVSEKELAKVAEGDADVLSKFQEIAPGQFANSVLAGILAERDAYRESRQKNRLSGLKTKTEPTHDNHMSNICSTHDNHMSPTTTTSTTTSTTTNTTTKKNRAIATEKHFDFLSVIPKGWDPEHFEKLVAGWVLARGKKKPTEYAKELAITDLIKYFPDWKDAKERMEKAIKGGWLDLVFKEDKETKSAIPEGRYANERKTIFDKA